MSRHLFGAVAVLFLTLTLAVPAGAITWGQLDSDELNPRYPAVGAIIVDFRATGSPEYGIGVYCSGTLVHPQVFLTAGHCAEGLVEDGITDADGYPIVFPDGEPKIWVSFNWNPSNLHPAPEDRSCETCLDIDHVVNSPLYNWGPTADPHDIAAIILAEPIPDEEIHPMDLASLNELEDLRHPRPRRNGEYREQFLVVGYGGSFIDAPPFFYEYLDLRQYAHSSFMNLLDAWLRVSQNQARGDEGTCYGDSGGPIFRTDEDGSLTVVAVTSSGDTACAAMGTYYRADTQESLDFIYDVIDSLGEPQVMPQ